MHFQVGVFWELLQPFLQLKPVSEKKNILSFMVGDSGTKECE